MTIPRLNGGAAFQLVNGWCNGNTTSVYAAFPPGIGPALPSDVATITAPSGWLTSPVGIPAAMNQTAANCVGKSMVGTPTTKTFRPGVNYAHLFEGPSATTNARKTGSYGAPTGQRAPCWTPTESRSPARMQLLIIILFICRLRRGSTGRCFRQLVTGPSAGMTRATTHRVRQRWSIDQQLVGCSDSDRSDCLQQPWHHSGRRNLHGDRAGVPGHSCLAVRDRDGQ